MAKNFTEDWLKEKGLVPDGKGNYIVQSNKNGRYGNSDNLIVKEKVNNSKDFSAKITTEWFIRGNVPSKKNSKRIVQHPKTKRSILIPSEAHEMYKKLTAMQYQVFGIEFKKAVKHYNLTYPLRVEFTYVRESKHRADFTNCQDTLQDLMVLHSWLPDDDMLHIIPSFQPREDDKNNPGVRIKLLLE